jgi:hypothetical protein
MWFCHGPRDRWSRCSHAASIFQIFLLPFYVVPFNIFQYQIKAGLKSFEIKRCAVIAAERAEA